MHFYRSLNPIKAFTFDLDDTLYDNSPYLTKAVEKMMTVINQVDRLQHVSVAQYHQAKQAVLLAQPEIYHDVLAWREQSIAQLLRVNGINHRATIEKIVDAAMTDFVFWRNKVEVPKDSLAILSTLAQKYPLAVISNGNADITKMGLGEYFQFSLRAGADGLSKPSSDMFKVAAEKLGVSAANIVHVGDNLDADVLGAINSGFQACWINHCTQDIYQHGLAKVLPHIEIKQLSELKSLI